MNSNNYVFVIPGGGGKTTLAKNNNCYIDIDDFWNINGKTESKMIKEFKEARNNNNNEMVKKIIYDCMNYKAEKIKNALNQINNKIILVQSIEQSKIILNNPKNIFCFVPSLELHESLMSNRKDSDFVKSVCRMQRNDIINSGWEYVIYKDFDELDNLIKKKHITFDRDDI
jgi:hypothetical protein